MYNTGPDKTGHMTKWLQSGRRRDICLLLAVADGGLRGQTLKTRLEAHYDDHIDPSSFYGSLSALVESGHLQTQQDGIHDVYVLTATGERRLREHAIWVATCVDDADADADVGERTPSESTPKDSNKK